MAWSNTYPVSDLFYACYAHIKAVTIEETGNPNPTREDVMCGGLFWIEAQLAAKPNLTISALVPLINKGFRKKELRPGWLAQLMIAVGDQLPSDFREAVIHNLNDSCTAKMLSRTTYELTDKEKKILQPKTYRVEYRGPGAERVTAVREHRND